MSSVLFRKARYENVRFLQTFRRLVVQDIEEEDFSRPANDCRIMHDPGFDEATGPRPGLADHSGQAGHWSQAAGSPAVAETER